MHMGTLPGCRYTPRGILPNTRPHLFLGLFLNFGSKSIQLSPRGFAGGHRIDFGSCVSFLKPAQKGPNKRGGNGVE